MFPSTQVLDALLPMLFSGAIGVLIGALLPRGRKALLQPEVTPPATSPVARATSADPVHQLPARRPQPAALTQVADLLLVDDSAVARAKLRRLFEAAGYQVHLACDGVEAQALLVKGHYALMITDLEMPNMDGIELIHACKADPRTAGMPVLAITGHEGLRAKFNECRDACGIHRKPWVDDILLSHVAALGVKRHERPAVAMA